MNSKEPLNHQRLRRLPRQFSWIDHRLVRDRHIEHCSHSAAALYLFLVTVSDLKGLSYYSDSSVMQRLSFDEIGLAQARQNLIERDLIAYKRPLYQVLTLESPSACSVRPSVTQSSKDLVFSKRLFIEKIAELRRSL